MAGMNYHYYNENDPYAAQWLRNLMAAGHIPEGCVDTRSVIDVQPEDLSVFVQCHFFAGIGGWPLALKLAGWPADRPVWTGSCPCQPFSVAGKRKGNSDERHLWPYFHKLISECKPATVFGEQVASKDGREWLSGVRTDLEAVGYAVGAADLCAASAGAPHIRQRLFWVADSESNRRREGQQVGGWRDAGVQAQRANGCAVSGAVGGLGNSAGERSFSGAQPGVYCGQEGRRARHGEPERSGDANGLGNSVEPGLEGLAGNGDDGDQPGRNSTQPDGSITAPGRSGFWRNFDLVSCRDGKTRRVESGVCPLAHGVPARVGKLRAYGNAIVPSVAAEFIEAFLEAAP